MIVPFIGGKSAYAAAFEQTAYGMPRYRGSPMMGGSFWERIISFAKGIFSKAAPHISNLVSQTQPQVGRAAQATDAAVDSPVTSIADKLKQTGKGKRKKPGLQGSKIK